MSQLSQRFRFVDPPVPRAKPIPRAKWDEHKEEMSSLYRIMTLEDLMAYMKVRRGFAPSTRQYIYHKDTPQEPANPARSQHQMSTSVENRICCHSARQNDPAATKRPKSVGSLHSFKSQRNSTERPRVPPKKHTFTNPESAFAITSGAQLSASTSTSPEYLPRLSCTTPSSGIVAGTRKDSNVPVLVVGSSNWETVDEQSDTDQLLSSGFDNLDMASLEKSSRLPHPGTQSCRRRFDSSRPIHTFSQEELIDMKMAAHFLHSLGCIRSAFSSPQFDIARSELFKALDEPRESATDVEHFIYRMLLADTYTRSDDKENEKFMSEIAIGCEIANDRMLDHFSDDHRSYDILTYHYLNKCLEYLNSFVQDTWDQGTLFVDKEHLQIRLLERIPGPFELRHGIMQNPCLRSCLQWCGKQLWSNLTFPDSWTDLQSKDQSYVYWSDHIGLYCAFWQRWQHQRRDSLGPPLDLWMSETETRMGITPAELLSMICGLIMSAAPSRTPQSAADLTDRAKGGFKAVLGLSDKVLGCQFLDTYSFMGTLFGAAPQRQFHDYTSFFATLLSSTRERAAYGQKARTFARAFIENDLNMVLPQFQRHVQPVQSRTSQWDSLHLSNAARVSMESLAATLLSTSIHSTEFSAMRSLRDQIQQASRRSSDMMDMLPSSVARMASRSHTSIPTVSDLSQLMADSLSLSSAQQAANATLDAIAADVMDLFSSLKRNPFSEKYGEVIES
ncbi:hypothetical protein K469DRAFT_728607 [Zopfia rhizophila CBS 207.26]|uniref:Clr5 domain-containing protein n=1 Tax=Zopfia rhizophila CBS 207.26 TaxID=1314779 RepID=A0A6A6DXR6_9PEZI|nr:hypothetical protein K469DRAFT_728607 [Zopfia rhizophila CBS 207.26]